MTPEELAEKWVGHDFCDGLNEAFAADLTSVIRGILIKYERNAECGFSITKDTEAFVDQFLNEQNL